MDKEKSIDTLFKIASKPAYTIEQLRKQGFNDAEIAGYQSIRDGLNMSLKDVVDEWKALDENCVEINAIVDKFIETNCVRKGKIIRKLTSVIH